MGVGVLFKVRGSMSCPMAMWQWHPQGVPTGAVTELQAGRSFWMLGDLGRGWTKCAHHPDLDRNLLFQSL